MTDLQLDTTWMRYAACRTADTSLFYPDRRGATGSAARQLCNTCPARAACLNYALTNQETFGVWGGMSARQRRRLIRQRRLEQQGAAA